MPKNTGKHFSKSKTGEKKATAASQGFKEKVFKETLMGISPPDHADFNDMEMKFWVNIVNARAVWTDIDKDQAVTLARVMADLENVNEQIKAAKPTALKDLRKVRELMARQAISAARFLQVHSVATVGDGDEQKVKNSEKRKAVEAVKQIHQEDDDFLARPIH